MPLAKYLGHSCVELFEGNQKLIVDPFLTGNEQAAAKHTEVDTGYILVSHGHGDHIGDAIAIAKRTGATIIGTFELTNLCAKKGVDIHPMHIGGAHDFDFGRVKLTIAHHGGGYGDDASIYTGPPVGFLIEIGGKTVYHAGDTGLFYDMKLIGEMNEIDLAFLPIGDNFTMGLDDAVKAVEFLQPKRVVPIHFNTFPVIKASPQAFAEKVKYAQVVILEPGNSIEI
ncbi:MAG: metal-dependent hydrolase [Candidatus Zixiibacteriota bacterium]|nr:MAG: metal-dependent hydrolase [candidate division Zixibacteria bacterium]